MGKKKSFIIYNDSINLINELTDEQSGIIFKACFNFNNGETVSFEDQLLSLVWKHFEIIFKNNELAYEETCKKNKENISKRWVKDSNTKNTTGKNGIPKIPSYTKNTDIDIDNDIDNKKDIDKFIAPSIEEVKEYYLRDILIKLELEPVKGFWIKFFHYYDTNNWLDAKGKKVRNWKNRLVTWINKEPHNKRLKDS